MLSPARLEELLCNVPAWTLATDRLIAQAQDELDAEEEVCRAAWDRDHEGDRFE